MQGICPPLRGSEEMTTIKAGNVEIFVFAAAIEATMPSTPNMYCVQVSGL
jgi:hypothetical protein